MLAESKLNHRRREHAAQEVTLAALPPKVQTENHAVSSSWNHAAGRDLDGARAQAARSDLESHVMGSFVGWLDHSEEDQRRVREMLQLFSDKDTVDDLGIGTVRDAISNSLFPGTSVIQTRARYFLFVPWLFRRAERAGDEVVIATTGLGELRNVVEVVGSPGKQG